MAKPPSAVGCDGGSVGRVVTFVIKCLEFEPMKYIEHILPIVIKNRRTQRWKRGPPKKYPVATNSSQSWSNQISQKEK